VRLGRLLDLPVRTIPYRGAGPAMNDVMGGAVPAMMDSLPSAGGPIRDGLVRAMALTAAQRVGTFPDLPTMRESGVALVNYSWFGLSGPAHLPPEITRRIAEATAAALKEPATIERFEQLLGAPPPSSTPEAYTQFVKDELAGFGPAVRAAKIEL
jgi:tripartite-type tricarboxylate transporter receptor subunit TctC